MDELEGASIANKKTMCVNHAYITKWCLPALLSSHLANQWDKESFLAFIPATCTEEGAISVIDDVVMACVNGSSRSVCYADESDILSSLAEASCSRDGLQLDSKSKFEWRTYVQSIMAKSMFFVGIHMGVYMCDQTFVGKRGWNVQSNACTFK